MQDIKFIKMIISIEVQHMQTTMEDRGGEHTMMDDSGWSAAAALRCADG